MREFDVVVIGAGAAGMMCAAVAGQRGRSVLVTDHADAPGKKIRISGGGRCNFTNIHTTPDRFLSANPRFAISALKRYTATDFIALVERYGIAYHEKTLGQLFCDGSSQQIIDMLRNEMEAGGAVLELETQAISVAREEGGFLVALSTGPVRCASLVVATGGKSIPKMGATGFAYQVAEQFGVPVVETRPALVPMTFEAGLLETIKPLAGIGLDVRVARGKTRFDEAMLFTHRGLSGPAILQISSYWREGDEMAIDMAPGRNMADWLQAARGSRGKQSVLNALAEILPRRVAQKIVDDCGICGNLADLSKTQSARLVAAVADWRVKPVGSEGYRTAEVTLGGIDTNALDAKTMGVKAVPGLYFVGEAVDVTGWLGGYNFQWAWASAWSAAQAV
ncbi:NAD(P)/FAD-dependent oxidoreductase [Pelagibacterium xiamenense]|uniref:NAD(P)/FAD-dependent oxidoreductase n=1 Tax=Pelagibacterium xiamenense TaxID=2901140 RepID=UPI001E304932|nr:NAD(P)/FAD-dependent oxidoreductase [Pelagibacterium xiamenense]MCD7060179.1 NAD(P)/FAD-dependent oxidoreductase [Pelagibacterium xiamenense]